MIARLLTHLGFLPQEQDDPEHARRLRDAQTRMWAVRRLDQALAKRAEGRAERAARSKAGQATRRAREWSRERDPILIDWVVF
jgi:hypothetical protein